MDALSRRLRPLARGRMSVPCDVDRPLPIAIRTQQYFKTCGLGAGRPLA